MKRLSPKELTQVEDVYGQQHWVSQRDLFLADRPRRGPFLLLYDAEGDELESDNLIHVDNIRKGPVSPARRALEKLFPIIDFVTMSASAEGNQGVCLIDYESADHMLHLIVQGLREEDEAGKDPNPGWGAQPVAEEGVSLNGKA